MDIGVRNEQISALSEQAKKFVDTGHFDAVAIQEREQALVARYKGLQVSVWDV